MFTSTRDVIKRERQNRVADYQLIKSRTRARRNTQQLSVQLVASESCHKERQEDKPIPQTDAWNELLLCSQAALKYHKKGCGINGVGMPEGGTQQGRERGRERAHTVAESSISLRTWRDCEN